MPRVSFSRRLLRPASACAAALLLLACKQDGAPGSDVSGAVVPGPSAAAVAGIELFAGSLGGAGNIDGTATEARFYSPASVAIAADGTLYVVDALNFVIRRISPLGVTTTLAGKAGESDHVDSATGTDARFVSPSGVALAGDGTLYVADRDSSTIRAISAAGEVTTLAGSDGEIGAVDATGADARFAGPTSIAIGPDGNLYVADALASTIRKVTPSGVVTTFAGQAGVSGSANGTGTEATFSIPFGLAFDSNGDLLVTDTGNNRIRKITPAGVVTTFAGSGSSGSADGTGLAASFFLPFGIVVDDADNAYVADTGNHTIRQITPAGVVSTLAGTADEAGYADDTGAAARFNGPQGIGLDNDGNVLVADSNNHVLRRITPAGVVTTVAGKGRSQGSTDDTGTAARFDTPVGMVMTRAGILLVADTLNHTLRSITAGGVVDTEAGAAGMPGSGNGSGISARFTGLQGLAIDDSDNVYVADTGSHLIRKISPAGVVTTLAGGAGQAGIADGTGTQARFAFPWGLVVDLEGVVYVTDTAVHSVRKVTPAGVVTTLAGGAGQFGTIDGTGTVARFRSPLGIARDGEGNLYVSDSGNHTIRKVTRAGEVTTVAGTAGAAGAVDATGADARFREPAGIAVDADGNLYVADSGNSLIRKISPAREVTTLVGTAGLRGVAPGLLPGTLNSPRGLTIGFDGELYVTDEDGVLRINLDTPVSVFDVRLEAPASVELGNSFTLRWRATDATNCVASDDWSGARATTGALTVTPGAAGTLSYTLTCDENGGSGSKSRTIDVAVTLPAPTVNFTISANRIDPGQSVTLTWSTANADSCTASGGWSGSQGLSGSTVLTPAATSTYTLSCTGLGGTTVRAVATTVAFVPTLTFTARPRNIALGERTTLEWVATNATTCTASGSWAGSQATSGSLVIKPSNSVAQAYTLICAGAGGVVEDTVVVEVAFATSTAGSAGGSGGAPGLGLLLGAGLLALLRRRYAT
jgi:sugar lactone lactonase YvrE